MVQFVREHSTPPPLLGNDDDAIGRRADRLYRVGRARQLRRKLEHGGRDLGHFPCGARVRCRYSLPRTATPAVKCETKRRLVTPIFLILLARPTLLVLSKKQEKTTRRNGNHEKIKPRDRFLPGNAGDDSLATAEASRLLAGAAKGNLSRPILFLHDLHHHRRQAVPVQCPTREICLLLPQKLQLRYAACCPFAARFVFSFLWSTARPSPDRGCSSLCLTPAVPAAPLAGGDGVSSYNGLVAAFTTSDTLRRGPSPTTSSGSSPQLSQELPGVGSTGCTLPSLRRDPH